MTPNGFCVCASERCHFVHLNRIKKVYCNYKLRAACTSKKCDYDHSEIKLAYTPPSPASRALVLQNGFVADRNYVTTSEATFLNKLTEIRPDGRFLVNFASSLYFYADNFPEQVFGRFETVTAALVKTVTHPKIAPVVLVPRDAARGVRERGFLEIDTFETVVVPVLALAVSDAFVAGMAGVLVSPVAIPRRGPAAFFTVLALDLAEHFRDHFLICLANCTAKRPKGKCLAANELLRKNYVPIFAVELFYPFIRCIDLILTHAVLTPEMRAKWIRTSKAYFALFHIRRPFTAPECAVVQQILQLEAKRAFVAAFNEARSQ